MKKCRHPVVHAFLWRKWEEKAFKIGRELRKNLVFTWLLILVADDCNTELSAFTEARVR